MPIAEDPIRVTGLKEFNRALRKLDQDLPKATRKALNEAADVVADWARPRVPVRTGRAQRSVRASSTRTQARVTGGGARVPWYPWLDFGGRVGRRRAVHRAFLPGGRFIYAGYEATKEQAYDAMVRALTEVAEGAGLAVRDG